MLLASAWPATAADSAQARYEAARTREARLLASRPTLQQLRGLINTYDEIVRRYPRSGYCDNALWQGARLAMEAHRRFGQERDRQTSLRMLEWLVSEYPSSSLRRHASTQIAQLESPGVTATTAGKERSTDVVLIRDIQRAEIDGVVRITVEMDGEVQYHEERLGDPARVFFDLKGARTVPALRNTTLAYGGDVVREIRLGQHPNETTRVVLDLAGVARYSVFSLYAPYRLVIDCVPDPTRTVRTQPPHRTPSATAGGPPTPPSTNSNGDFSMARQLGLGVARIVIDPGHGGRDPGARGKGIRESEVVLDVARRLEELLSQDPRFEVVMTRRSDEFVALEERTAIANRERADLFLSIHANASRRPHAGGAETYFLNFASNPEAEAVAARENSSSGRTMRNLPDMVQAIALNNKLDESRDFAEMVQQAMARRLRTQHPELKDLGVKQAPFVVLIGAKMPSVLSEISFVTNATEARLLADGGYRQRIAEALYNAVRRYQSSLKQVGATAEQ